MQSQEYKNLIKKAPFAFAYHKIILDDNQKPIDYEFIEINEAFETLTGLEKSKTIGHKVTELIPEITKDPFNWIAFYGEVALNGGEKEFEQYAQGIKKWYKVQAFSTKKYYFSTLFIDISEEKIAQQKLLETNKELELAKAKAESANKSKSEFLANMSHEIRTPLNGVIGFTDLLFGTELNNTQQQYVKNANISAHSLLGIINDILDFSKIEAGKMELDFIKTDIIELLEKTCDIVKYQASQKGIELLLDIQLDIPRFLMIDPMRLKQILVNLLGNSVKFTEVGKIELKVSFIPQNKSSGLFVFSVLDTGIGINVEQQKKLFDAFTQADLSTTRKFGGTGLGLTISNMLAKKMKSNIEVISEVNKGSVFYFTVETEYEFGSELDFNNLKDIKRVLLVDDNLSNSLILQKTFNYFKIDFSYVNSALEAINILEQNQNNNFDVIIIDYNMPNLNGLDLIRMMKEQLNFTIEEKNIILLHNSLDDIKIYDEAKNLGIRFNLTKPIKNQELLCCFKEMKKSKSYYKEKSKKNVFVVDIENNKLPVILIAEDVSMNMLLLKTIIKQIVTQVNILEAKNGKEALDLAILAKPDLVFMDIQMPEMNGIDATKEIRNYEYYKDSKIPIVALTAGALNEEKEKCLAVGMNDFLTKPIEQKELYEILKKYLLN